MTIPTVKVTHSALINTLVSQFPKLYNNVLILKVYKSKLVRSKTESSRARTRTHLDDTRIFLAVYLAD